MRHLDSFAASSSAYQETYTEYLAKSRFNVYPYSAVEKLQLHHLIELTRDNLHSCSDPHVGDLLSKTLECQESLLSPVRKLPPDMLNEIFSIAAIEPSGFKVQLDAWRPIYTGGKLRGTVFALTWVCSWWRDHAVLQSDLWSSLSIRTGPSNQVREEVWAFLKECILRSGDLAPLDLNLGSFVLDSPSFQLFCSDAWDVLDVLVDRAHRWRLLGSGSLVNMPSNSFPCSLSLSSLTICNTSHYPEIPLNIVLEKSFPCCPRLHTLGLNYLEATCDIDQILGNLTVLKIEYYSGRSFAHLLGRCPLLRTLAIHKFRQSEDPFSKPLYSHSNLSILDIRISSSFATGVWDNVRLPNLTELEISFGVIASATYFDNEVGNALYELQKMLIRSRCSLKTVRIYEEGYIIPPSASNGFINSIPLSSDAKLSHISPWK
ncbi:hypothetical protein GYMLUDRAFT_391071 [Collybiopsis luxurians FD-317 M1]|uniref:F-box domain-containing protein n=1 Tax=Collybiopsis luxurians FD-317 M1 TaxID=944289 RepID=A0A0D0BB75_9AGAR|nr:hypothetical protein GYMLUDRAFT_391071 [Collybiopsis luxurians FD-317 M1]